FARIERRGGAQHGGAVGARFTGDIRIREGDGANGCGGGGGIHQSDPFPCPLLGPPPPPPPHPGLPGVGRIPRQAGGAALRWGRAGWGVAARENGAALPDCTTPTPNPSPQGGGELTECVARSCIKSPKQETQFVTRGQPPSWSGRNACSGGIVLTSL